MKRNLWLIGSGQMAKAYCSVLQNQGISFRVIGRGKHSAEKFYKSTGVPVYLGGLESALAVLPSPSQAILAVDINELASSAELLLAAGCRRLLLEKPGAITLSGLKVLCTEAEVKGAKIWIAYNRRFFASVQKLHQLAEADGGIISALFEFTERSHIIKNLQKANNVKERWLLANSTHVIDLAFHFVGMPATDQWQNWTSGSLDWHPAAARFHGAGVSERGIPFVYQADWEAPGNWGIELLTRRNRYLLRPLEALQMIPLSSVETQSVKLDDELDKQFKPGLYLQCQSFLNDQPQQLCSLSEQLKAFPIYERIAGYSF